MSIRQQHNGEGDNVAGDKIIITNKTKIKHSNEESRKSLASHLAFLRIGFPLLVICYIFKFPNLGSELCSKSNELEIFLYYLSLMPLFTFLLGILSCIVAIFIIVIVLMSNIIYAFIILQEQEIKKSKIESRDGINYFNSKKPKRLRELLHKEVRKNSELEITKYFLKTKNFKKNRKYLDRFLDGLLYSATIFGLIILFLVLAYFLLAQIGLEPFVFAEGYIVNIMHYVINYTKELNYAELLMESRDFVFKLFFITIFMVVSYYFYIEYRLNNR